MSQKNLRSKIEEMRKIQNEVCNPLPPPSVNVQSKTQSKTYSNQDVLSQNGGSCLLPLKNFDRVVNSFNSSAEKGREQTIGQGDQSEDGLA